MNRDTFFCVEVIDWCYKTNSACIKKAFYSNNATQMDLKQGMIIFQVLSAIDSIDSNNKVDAVDAVDAVEANDAVNAMILYFRETLITLM